MNKKNTTQIVLSITLCLLLGMLYGTDIRITVGKTAQDYYNKGIELLEEKRYEEAQEQLSRAVKLVPGHPYYRYALAVALGNTGRVEEAKKELKKVVEKLPQLQQAWYYLRIFWLKTTDVDDAEKYFEKMSKKKQKPAVVLNYAYILMEQKNWESALKQIEKAINLRPWYSEAYLCKGKVLQEGFNDVDGAIESFRKALELDPDFAEAHYNLGMLLINKESDQEATKHLETAKKLKPSLTEKVNNLLAKSSTRSLTLRGREMTIKPVAIITISFSESGIVFVADVEKDREKEINEKIKEAVAKQPKELIKEYVFGKEKSIFDYRNTPNFYLKFTYQKHTQKCFLAVRKIPDINLRFDPEGVIVEDTEVTKGYTRELTKNTKIELDNILFQESKVIVKIKTE